MVKHHDYRIESQIGIEMCFVLRAQEEIDIADPPQMSPARVALHDAEVPMTQNCFGSSCRNTRIV